MQRRTAGDAPLIDLSRAPAAASFPKPILKAIEAVFGINRINAIFRQVDSRERSSFVNSTLTEMSLSIVIEGEDRLASLDGPTILFGNHPLGLADQFLLAALMSRNFQSFRILANMYMNFGASFEANIIPVDPFRSDAWANASALRTMMNDFGRDYQALGIFPSGICSRYQPARKSVSDPPWSEAFWKLARMKDAKLVPIFFEGRNSAFFHAAARLTPTLAPALLPREFLRVRGQTLRAIVGEPVNVEDVAHSAARNEQGAFLRSLVYELGTRDGCNALIARSDNARSTKVISPRSRSTAQAPLNCLNEYRVQIFRGLDTGPTLRAGLALRHQRFRDQTSALDELFYHFVLVNRETGRAAGYLRVLDWRVHGPSLGSISPTLQCYRLGAHTTFTQGLLEIGRFCTDADQRSPIVPLLLWKSVAKLAGELGGRTGAIGMVTLLGAHPSLAAAQFAVLQAAAPADLGEAEPIRPLLQAVRHHDWSPSATYRNPSMRIDSLLKVYRSAGARFGPACRMRVLDDSPAILTVLKMEDLNVQLRGGRERPLACDPQLAR